MTTATGSKRTGYVAPRITVWGSLADLTAANNTNHINDVPIGQIGQGFNPGS
ncbi:MAG: hypothetical protein M3066_10770 [Actinomycetota bacterium]|nr:hypothetical protein [Actinomycetota bacterium]